MKSEAWLDELIANTKAGKAEGTYGKSARAAVD
jgi:hypothetical protein